MGIAVVVGDPKPQSRTLEAAVHVATQLAGVAPTVVVDVIELGPGLLGWGDPALAQALGAICPVKGLYLLDKAFTDPAMLDPWLAVARGFVPAVAGAPA